MPSPPSLEKESTSNSNSSSSSNSPSIASDFDVNDHPNDADTRKESVSSIALINRALDNTKCVNLLQRALSLLPDLKAASIVKMVCILMLI